MIADRATLVQGLKKPLPRARREERDARPPVQSAEAEVEESFDAALGLLADKDSEEGATRALAVQAHLGNRPCEQ